jgi:hypothetical protein
VFNLYKNIPEIKKPRRAHGPNSSLVIWTRRRLFAGSIFRKGLLPAVLEWVLVSGLLMCQQLLVPLILCNLLLQICILYALGGVTCQACYLLEQLLRAGNIRQSFPSEELEKIALCNEILQVCVWLTVEMLVQSLKRKDFASGCLGSTA